MKIVEYLILIATSVFVVGMVFVYSGVYPMGADVPHNKLTYWLLETVREQSVGRASKNITVPSLDDPELLLMGGPDYNDMCVACHLKPGKIKSDMSIGLYPAPLNLSQREGEHGHDHAAGGHGDSEQSSKRRFWIIKHGIKASGMPAWGPTHDDQRIWAMVAFLQKLPELTPEQYQILTARDEFNESSHH
jgi:mono/diheme cytochrome c family protein|tara:strand:- start:252 stop:821 length:570 start_codon:yes stop_codon:yes gene_type:complete